MYRYIIPGEDSSSASNTSTTNTVTSTMSSDIRNKPLNLTRFGVTISRRKKIKHLLKFGNIRWTGFVWKTIYNRIILICNCHYCRASSINIKM